jgi:hypothetical protein
MALWREFFQMQKLDMVMVIANAWGMFRSLNTTPAKVRVMVGDKF